MVAGLAVSSAAGSGAAAAARPATKPNVVFILTDDLSWNLVNRKFAPHIVALEKHGETFNHYFVTDSLCCPSRSTIFTGLFAHDGIRPQPWTRGRPAHARSKTLIPI